MRLFPETAEADAKRIIVAKGLRAIGDGYVSLVLPAYLLLLGYSAVQIGALMTATLLGSAIMTFLTGMITARFGTKRPLLAASALMIFTGLGFALLHEFWPLLLVAFIGTLNPSAGDVSMFLPLEQSLLARSVGDKDRTLLFAFYSVSGSLMAAVGTLVASVSDFGPRSLGISQLDTMRLLFVVYALRGAAAALIYRRVAEQSAGSSEKQHTPEGPSRSKV